MTSLEELVITTIEQSSGIELPQEDRTSIQQIISKNEFDERTATQFTDIYINVNHKYPPSSRIRKPFNILKMVLTRTELQTQPLNKLLSYFQQTIQFHYDNNTYNSTDITNFLNNLFHLILSLNDIKNPRILERNFDIIDKLFIIDYKLQFPNHHDLQIESILPRFGLNTDNVDQLNNNELDEYLHNIDTVAKFLDQLTKHKEADNHLTKIPDFLRTCISYALGGKLLFLNRLIKGMEFLSQCNPEETLPKVLIKLNKHIEIDLTDLKIPDYELVDYLGEGAFKKVYLARSKIDKEKYVAVAVFDPEHIKRIGRIQLSRIGTEITPEALEKAIQREFQPSKLDEIKHPHKEHIINIHHVGRTDRFAYMTYDPYDINLKELLKQKIDSKQIQQILINIASGLSGCHNTGIIHRDLHAGNIGLIFDKDDKLDRAILSDFGQMSEFSFQQNEHSPISPLQTRPPEQFLTKEEFEKYKQANTHKFPKGCNLDFELQKRSNIFNFGCIAYQLITGRTPFWPTNPDGTLTEDPLTKDSSDLEGRLNIEKQILNIMETQKDKKGSYKKFLEQDSSFRKAPKYLRNLITKCLMHNPEDRYDNFNTVINYLEAEGHPLFKKTTHGIFGRTLREFSYRLIFVAATTILFQYTILNDKNLAREVSLGNPIIAKVNQNVELTISPIPNIARLPTVLIEYNDVTKFKDTSKMIDVTKHNQPINIKGSSFSTKHDFHNDKIILTSFDSEGIKAISVKSPETSISYPKGKLYDDGTILIIDDKNERQEISDLIDFRRTILNKNKFVISINEVQLLNLAYANGLTKNTFTHGLYWLASNERTQAYLLEDLTKNLNGANSGLFIIGAFLNPTTKRMILQDSDYFGEMSAWNPELYLVMEKDGTMLFGKKTYSPSTLPDNTYWTDVLLVADQHPKYLNVGNYITIYCLRVLKDSNNRIILDNQINSCKWTCDWTHDNELYDNLNSQRIRHNFFNPGKYTLSALVTENSPEQRTFSQSIDLYVHTNESPKKENKIDKVTPLTPRWLTTRIKTNPDIDVVEDLIHLQEGQPLLIDASESSVAAHNISSYELDLGDGRIIQKQSSSTEPITTSSLIFPKIIYPNWGFYNIRLTLTNDNGDHDARERLIFVEPPK